MPLQRSALRAADSRSAAFPAPAPPVVHAMPHHASGHVRIEMSIAVSMSARRPGARWSESMPADAWRPPDQLRVAPSNPRAVPVFLYHRLQHVLIQAQIGDELLQSVIFLTQRSQFLSVLNFHAAILRFPGVDRVLRDPHLPRHLGHTAARFNLLQNPDDLLGVQLALWHLVSPFVRPKSYFVSGEYRGSGHQEPGLTVPSVCSLQTVNRNDIHKGERNLSR